MTTTIDAAAELKLRTELHQQVRTLMREGERDPERITALIMERHNPLILAKLRSWDAESDQIAFASAEWIFTLGVEVHVRQVMEAEGMVDLPFLFPDPD